MAEERGQGKRSAEKKKSKKSIKGHHESKLEKLKNVVIRILKKHPEGVLKNDIWTLVHKETGLRVCAKDYGVSKMGRVFERWTDSIRTVSLSNAEKLFFVDEQSAEEKLSADFPLKWEDFDEKTDSATKRNCLNPAPELQTEHEEDIMYERNTGREQVKQGSSYIHADPDKDLTLTSEFLDQKHDKFKKSKQYFADRFKQNGSDVTFGFLSDLDASDETEGDTEEEKKEIKSVLDELMGDVHNTKPQPALEQKPKTMPSWVHIAQASKHSVNTMPGAQEIRIPLQVREQQGRSATNAEEQRIIAAEMERSVASGQVQEQCNLSKPPGHSSVSKEPVSQGSGSTQSELPAHSYQQSGVPRPDLGPIRFPAQDVNRFFMPVQSYNQLGMMFPNFGQTRMTLLGMPLTYNIPVPAHGQFRAGISANQNTASSIVVQPHQATEVSGMPTPSTTQRESPSQVTISDSRMSPTVSQASKVSWNCALMSEKTLENSSPVPSPRVVLNTEQNRAKDPMPAWMDEQKSKFSQVQMPPLVSTTNARPLQNFVGITESVLENVGSRLGMSSARNSCLYTNQTVRPSAMVNQMTMNVPVEASASDAPSALTSGWRQYEVTKHNKQLQTVIDRFDGWGLDRWQPFADDVKDISVKPIDKEEFPTKVIDVRPVYVPPGRKPLSEQIDSVAKECIEILADANEFVTQERVEKLLLQRFRCSTIQELGINHVDQIPCVYELNRLLSKINVYITAFLKTRSICTLYELKEAIKDYAPDKEEFSSLKTGPLQRFPVVFQQFRFPPDIAEIPEITSMDILEHFNNYLTKNKLWVNGKLELEPFMNHLVQEYDADNAYQLGVRIRSLPLAIGVLKKAKRDSGASHRAMKDHFEENLKAEIGDAFRKFRISILQTGEGDGMEVRRHYLKMKPELVIMEIFDKFNVLLMLTQDKRQTKPTRYRRIIEDFLTEMREDDLGKNILHLAICMSNTAVEETVKDIFTPAGDEENEIQIHQKPPPRKDALVGSLKTYIERCLNAGAFSLTHLNRIEEKMLEDFGFPDFNMMGYGRFLEFLLLEETKQVLEESVGLHLGSGSGGGDSDTSFKPHQMDLVEFIKQCKQQEDSQPDQIEDAVCAHYSVNNVRDLGYGNITRLLSYAEKHGRHMLEQFSVFYESALVPSVRFSQNSKSKVGILGHQTRDAAKICLHNCPLLENMADWCQWNLVYEPELGKLKDFVQKYGGVTTKTMEGGKIVTLDFLALETKPGELIKIVSSTSVENVAVAVNNRDVQSTTGHLVSMVVAYKGIVNMPLALIARHMKTALIQMHAEEPRTDLAAIPAIQSTAALFVLQCLLRIPTKISVSLANQIFLEPLGQVVGSSKSKQMLVQLCKTETELSQLIKLGCFLGIQEWTDVIQRKCQIQDTDTQILPFEMKEFFGKEQYPEEEDEYIEVASDSATEDVDEILAGELLVDEIKATVGNGINCVEDSQSKNESVAGIGTENLEVTDDVVTEEVTSCEAIVNEIRRDEFGVGVQLSEDGQRLMKVQQERLGRSLDRLSKDLYSKDTHFVLELIQNADDNSYSDNLLKDTSDDCPSVKFVIEHDGICVLNNELGFREKDIRALCDVGRSTKGKHKFGYIGQKGIGFKSVFRITDAPEVHSNGYHIRFDVNSGPMGYILPHWVTEKERIGRDGWMTHITLKLKPEMRQQTRTLAARFNDIHPSLLLFLHRLRQIIVENKVEDSLQTMRRRDIGNNIVEIQHTHGCERWLVIKKMLDASKVSIQTKSGADVESTEIALAFPLKQQGKRTTVQKMPPKQLIFAFLPLRSYGFRFIIQGDFDVPSSREDVDRDSSWNQWLRNEIHNVFIDCLDIFKTHPDFSCMEAVSAFLQFVPNEDEVLDFFKPVASDILKKLKAKPCIPTQPNTEGAISWKMPSQTVKVRDPLVRSVITADLLEEHLNLFYLHSDVAAMINPTLASSLGIETLTCDHLFQLGKALIVIMGTHCSKEQDILLISNWMACLYRSLDEFHHDDAILTTLKSHRMFPLSDGELVSLHDKTVFYPIRNSGSNRQNGKDPLYYLQQDVKSLHPMLLNTDDNEVNSQVQKLLLRIGIKQLSPFDVINHHILPVLKSDMWKTKQPETLISYLVFVKEQTEKQASVCNMDEFKEVAMVMTNKGFKNPHLEPVHFPTQYGNQIHLIEIFGGYDWTLLDLCYLPKQSTQTVVISWQNFFRKLGVEDFLSFRKKDVRMKREELEQSVWKCRIFEWPQEGEEFTLEDYYCAEVEGLITNNRYENSPQFAEQMSHLFTYLDRHWKSRFSRYCKCQILDKEGKKLKETESSFSILLTNSKWVPAVQTVTTQDEMGFLNRDVQIVIKQPACLYNKSEAVQGLLFDKVLYLNSKTIGGPFCQFLGIKNSVDVKTVKDLLIQWGKRKDESPAAFCTTLAHMKTVYQYLCSQLTREDFQLLLKENPVFFVPDKNAVEVLSSQDVVVPGKMLKRTEIWLFDRTGLFAKHRRVLEDFHSEICSKRTIAEFYDDSLELIEMFKQEAKLDVQPKVDEYITLMCLLCNTSSPKETAVLRDVLYIFSTIGEMLVTPPVGILGRHAANSSVEALRTFVKRKLKREKVFPTNKQVWVSLEDQPMIPDNRDWEKMFIDKPGVHFLDMDDKSNVSSRTVKDGTLHRRYKNKVPDSKLQPEMINAVLEVCNVRKLSECVDIRPTPEMISPCPQMQKYFSQIVPVLQQYLMAKYDDVFQSLEQMNIRTMLKDAKFYQTGHLEVSYWLPNMVSETFVIQQEKCIIHPPEFYFHREHLTDFKEMLREIARYFSRGNSDCNNLLRSFLTDLTDIISGVSEEPVEGLLQRFDADCIEIPEDDKWEVEAPVLLDINKPDGKEEGNGLEEDTTAEKAEQEAGSFEIRAWPPVASGNRAQHRDTSEITASNIWPPPRGDEYMRSIRDLPSNVRIVTQGNDSDSKIPGDNTDSTFLVPTIETLPRDTDVSQGMFTKQTDSGCPRPDVSNQSSPMKMEAVNDDNAERQPAKDIFVMNSTSETGRQTKFNECKTDNAEEQFSMSKDEIREDTCIDEDSQQKSDNVGRESPQNITGTTESPETKKYQQKPDRQHYGRRRFISGDPFWSNMATEYTYDDLGSGKDICVLDISSLTEGAGDSDVGQWGEALVAQYLQRQKELGNIHDFLWKNREDESGSPFDFEIQLKGDSGVYRNFIEVKSTMTENKEVFEISIHQIKFANRMKDSFHIYRVFNAGNPERVKLIRISDLNKRLWTKQVKLCMLI